MNSRAILATVAAVAVLFAGIGWVAGQRIKSPAEAAAEKEPPDPSLITVPVEMRELSQNLVIRGTVLADDATPLDVSSASGETIITRLPKEAGQDLVEGDVAIEVAGRPVFVLEGQLPVFRSLIPTLDGPDVKQLEEALKRLGFDPGTVDEVYDGATADAVEEMYRKAGYTPIVPTDEELAGVKTARDAVKEAENSVNEAKKAADEASAGPSESERIELDRGVTQAQQTLDDAESGADVTAAVNERKAAEKAANEAKAALDQSNQRLEQAKGGTSPDSGEAPTPDELASLEDEVSSAKAQKESADAELTAAKDTEAKAVQGKDRAIEDAKTALRLAELARKEGLATDNADAMKQLADANTSLTETRKELTSVEARVDTQFPAAELRFLPSLPRKIQTLTAEVGTSPTGPVMNITGSTTSITSSVAAADRKLISVGQAAILEDDDLGIRADAAISSIAEAPGGGEISSDRYRLKIEPNEDLPEEALGVNFRITIPVTSSGGEVMAVPLAALSAAADGSARVEVERSPGQTELVKVSPGLRTQGFVQVDAVDGNLAEGDRVVVGRDLVLPNADTETPSDSEDDEDSEPEEVESDSETDSAEDPAGEGEAVDDGAEAEEQGRDADEESAVPALHGGRTPTPGA